ncbi:MAG: DnaD domain protein [Chloroflexi bacterium]|nr:DnaD domain protein [Chloroflexota bacterium]
MQGFSGFAPRGRMTKLPGQFFSDLLPQIDHLGELKVTLYCFWNLQQRQGDVVYLTRSDILRDELFMAGMGHRQTEREEAVSEGLERAVARGTLLHAHIASRGIEDHFYFVNTPRNQAILQDIEAGRWKPSGFVDAPIDLTIERPNIFTLYEQNVGPLTPIIADKLKDIEETYGPAWFEEAVEIAVTRNVRKLAYIESILKRWQSEGKGGQQGRSEVEDKYADELIR